MSEDGSVTEEDVADGHQQRALDSEGYGVEEEEEGAAAGDGAGGEEEEDADNCSGPASPVLTPRDSPGVQGGVSRGARGSGRGRACARGAASARGGARGSVRGGASSSRRHATPSVHTWLLEKVELTAEEVQIVEKCFAASPTAVAGGMRDKAGAGPNLDALCALPEEKLGELLAPIKPRGLRALVSAALTDRKLALNLKNSVGM